jgi:hypothetical protein
MVNSETVGCLVISQHTTHALAIKQVDIALLILYSQYEDSRDYSI